MITDDDPSYVMFFRDAADSVEEFTTRIGGDPEWVGEAQWPLCAGWDNPMEFVAQFRLPGDELRMAYLFMCDRCEETFAPEAGKNALIVQPGRLPPFITTIVPRWEPSPGGGVVVDLEPEGPGDLKGYESRMYGEPAWLQHEEYPPGGPAVSPVSPRGGGEPPPRRRRAPSGALPCAGQRPSYRPPTGVPRAV